MRKPLSTRFERVGDASQSRNQYADFEPIEFLTPLFLDLYEARALEECELPRNAGKVNSAALRCLGDCERPVVSGKMGDEREAHRVAECLEESGLQIPIEGNSHHMIKKTA